MKLRQVQLLSCLTTLLVAFAAQSFDGYTAKKGPDTAFGTLYEGNPFVAGLFRLEESKLPNLRNGSSAPIDASNLTALYAESPHISTLFGLHRAGLAVQRKEV